LTIIAVETLVENLTILVLACATRKEMVSNRTHRNRRNAKNNYTFSRIVRGQRVSPRPGNRTPTTNSRAIEARVKPDCRPSYLSRHKRGAIATNIAKLPEPAKLPQD
jgi:hypothetical protein